MDKISFWASRVEDALRIKGVIPPATTELFLEPYEDMETCGYYFIDHTTRSESWIDQVSTEVLQLERVVSISHLSASDVTEFFLCIFNHCYLLRNGSRRTLLDTC
jgi:hypothetical protein